MKKIALLVLITGLLLPVISTNAQGDANCLVSASLDLKRSSLVGASWFAAVEEAREECASGEPVPTPTTMNVVSGRVLSRARQFNVSTSSIINLRTGPGTSYEKAGQTQPGKVMKVLATGEDDQGREWYRIDARRWLAGWLSNRAPDVIVETNAGYTQGPENCGVSTEATRGDREVRLILQGDKYDQIHVDLTRPGETRPLRVVSQNLREFIDSKGTLYYDQQYNWRIGWPDGMYTIHVKHAGNEKTFGWNLDGAQKYLIRVRCD